MAEKQKLTRSGNKIIAGVCSGIAEFVGWDPTIVRLLYAVLTIASIGTGVFIYLILWIIMPEN